MAELTDGILYEAFFDSYDVYDGHNTDSTTNACAPVDAQIANLNQLNRSLQAELDKSMPGPTSLRSFDALLRSMDGDSDDPAFLSAPYDDDDDDEEGDADADLLELSAELDSVLLSPYTPTQAAAPRRGNSDSSAALRHRISDHWQSPLLSPMGAADTDADAQRPASLSAVQHDGIGSRDGSRDASGSSSAFLSNSFIVQAIASTVSPLLPPQAGYDTSADGDGSGSGNGMRRAALFHDDDPHQPSPSRSPSPSQSPPAPAQAQTQAPSSFVPPGSTDHGHSHGQGDNSGSGDDESEGSDAVPWEGSDAVPWVLAGAIDYEVSGGVGRAVGAGAGA